MTDLIAAALPASFLQLALAHFVALLSPGPDFFLIVGHAVRARLRGSALICAGIALGNAVYIALAVAGWAGMRNSPTLYNAIALAGACYLVWMGLLLLRSSRVPSGRCRAVEARAVLSGKSQFCAGLASALLNPKNALFYLTLMMGILGSAVTLTQQIAAGIWMVSVVLAWDLALAAGISHEAAQRFLAAKIPVIEGIAGLVLLAAAAGILLSSPVLR